MQVFVCQTALEMRGTLLNFFLRTITAGTNNGAANITAATQTFVKLAELEKLQLILSLSLSCSHLTSASSHNTQSYK